MKILAINTSWRHASVAVRENKQIVSFCQDEQPNMQAENLFALIDEAFAQSGLSYQDNCHVAITTGPGSFTGIRIGLSAVQGMLLAAKHLVPMAFSDFEVAAFMALRQVSCAKQIVTIFPASISTLYLQSFNQDLSPIHNPLIIEAAEICHYLRPLQEITVLAGSGIALAWSYLNWQQNAWLQNPIALPRYPQLNAKLLTFLAGYYLRFNKPCSSELAPLYIKPPSAKVSQ